MKLAIGNWKLAMEVSRVTICLAEEQARQGVNKMPNPTGDTLWYQTNLDIFLNRWFSNYEEARQSLEDEGGFLLPFRHHFYVCEAPAIRLMGLDADDPDWEKIGWNCARPLDENAYQRLYQKREQFLEEQNRSDKLA